MSNTITRQDIVTAVSNDTGLCRQDVALAINKAMDFLADEIGKGNRAELRYFGTFTLRGRAGRVRHNPDDITDKVDVPPHNVVIFKPCMAMKIAARKVPVVVRK